MNKWGMRMTIYKNTILAVGLGLGLLSTAAVADVSYNIGFASEYHYRGVFQNDSSASAGVDYRGRWILHRFLGCGRRRRLEIDGYFGYGMEFDRVFTARRIYRLLLHG